MVIRDELYDIGITQRRIMFGPEGAEKRVDTTTDLNDKLEDFVTRETFGDIWQRPGLSIADRSKATVAMLLANGKEHELRVHAAGALENGVTPIELREIVLQGLLYCGIPAGVLGTRVLGEVFAARGIDGVLDGEAEATRAGFTMTRLSNGGEATNGHSSNGHSSNGHSSNGNGATRTEQRRTAMSTQTTTLLDEITEPPKKSRAIPDAATGEPIGFVHETTPAELDEAVRTARAAQPAWAALGHAERSRLLHAAADEIDAGAEELAQIISKEQGKPVNGLGARFEAGGCSAWLRAAADIELEPEVLFEAEGTRSELHYVPLGVVGAISPWNWPALIAIWQIAPSLRMGNTVVAKPSEYTPLSVMAVGALMNRVLPPGVLTVVPGDREIGAAITAHPDIDKIMFTGSTATGRQIVKSSANNLARLTLELGGNDPGIVLPGADVKELVERMFWGAFINTGQTCAALKRLYVHDSLYDEVVDELAKMAASMRLGPGTDESSVLGPLSTKQQFDIVSDLVEDARKRGARIVTGGKPAPELGAHFYQATVVADVDDDARVVSEEQFGPVLPIIRYTDLDDVIERANASDQALGASVWGDPEQAKKVAERIESGTVWINQHGTINPLVPFGGMKGSGYGLEFGAAGLKAVAATKVITV